MKNILKNIKAYYLTIISLAIALNIPHIAFAAEADLLGKFINNNIHIPINVFFVVKLIAILGLAFFAFKSASEEGGLQRAGSKLIIFVAVYLAVGFVFDYVMESGGFTDTDKTVRMK